MTTQTLHIEGNSMPVSLQLLAGQAATDHDGFLDGRASDAIRHPMKARHACPSIDFEAVMTDNTPKLRLLGISGSLRKGSFNTTILASLGASEERASLQILPLNDLPPYDQDADTATPPEAVVRIRAAIGSADGLVIASPEYNHSSSGVLKNALDWASRPFGRSTLSGKPVLTLTSSTAFTGGVRAQARPTEVLAAIAARLVHRPQTVIGSAYQKKSLTAGWSMKPRWGFCRSASTTFYA